MSLTLSHIPNKKKVCWPILTLEGRVIFGLFHKKEVHDQDWLSRKKISMDWTHWPISDRGLSCVEACKKLLHRHYISKFVEFYNCFFFLFFQVRFSLAPSLPPRDSHRFFLPNQLYFSRSLLLSTLNNNYILKRKKYLYKI